jgi:stearoyl-CoA desaturase (delta-9 desaturase)
MEKIRFIDALLYEPTYGWKDVNGQLSIPTKRELFRETLSRINIFKSTRNWISFVSLLMLVSLVPFFLLFITKYFSWYLLIIVIAYSMIVMGTHGTIWFHRYCTHKSYTFSNRVWRFITQNLVIKTLPEESYVLSHHVHHSKSDQPGDPYNAQAGFLYCMLAEYNHQRISPDLNAEQYAKAASFLGHTGVRLNTFTQFKKWGCATSPKYVIATWALNWTFWYLTLFYLGGPPLACAVFTGAFFWFAFIRAFNYTGHGGGKIKHREGIDFDRRNLSINQARPGLLAGEWHNNHHLYPGSARAGFLPGQVDLAWLYILTLYKLKMVSGYKDSKKEFIQKFVTRRHNSTK